MARPGTRRVTRSETKRAATGEAMTSTAANLKRPILIFLSKNGVFQFARKGTAKHLELSNGSIACASVNTLAEAEEIQTATCKLSYDGKLFLYPFDHTLRGLELAGQQIERLYEHHKSGAKGWPEGWAPQ